MQEITRSSLGAMGGAALPLAQTQTERNETRLPHSVTPPADQRGGGIWTAVQTLTSRSR